MEQISDIQEAVAIYNRGISNLYCNPTEWENFLKFSSKFYKYKFHENLLLYTQDKDITACATFDEWKKIGRYVKPYSKSLKTLYEKNGRLYLKSVFDLKDTNSKTDVAFNLWKITEKDAIDILLDKLDVYLESDNYQLSDIINVYAINLLSTSEFMNELELTEKEIFTDDFYSVFLESITTTILSRCDIEYSPDLSHLENITNKETLKRIGFAVNKYSYELLKILELEVKERKNKELEESLNERNSIEENDESIGGNSSNQISRIDNEWNDKRIDGNILSRDSFTRRNHRRKIKGQVSKTRYRGVYRNSSIREHDKNINIRNNQQYDRRQSQRDITSKEGVVQTTLFNLSETIENGIQENELSAIKEVTDINPFDEDDEIKEYAPLPSLFKIPNNLKDESHGLKKKYQENIEAIKLLKELETDNREATDDEKVILAKYNGWGGLSTAFEETSEQYQELQSLLTIEEFNNARESALTSFYTEPFIIDFMYKAVQRFGLNTKCRILDPSAGVGNFIGRLPDEFKNSEITAVEKDSITGRLLKKIYNSIDVQIRGYEDTKLNNNYYDLAISNIPFGNFGVFDKSYDNTLKIHDYFFEKTLDKVKPCGIVAFITSRYTLDKADDNVRQYINSRANFIGAVRLPNNAFKQMANTEAISDIIFLQKKGREIENTTNWLDTFMLQDGITINNYFAERKYMIKGDVQITRNQYNETLDVVPTGNLNEQLDETLKMLPSNIINIDELKEISSIEQSDAIPVGEQYNYVRDYTFTEINGSIYYRINDYLYEQNKNQTTLDRIKGLIKIRTALRSLINIQNKNVPDSAIKSYQATLNRVYDEFVKKYGHISDRVNNLAFRNDADFPLLISLEKEDKETKKIIKTDIFSKRTIKPYKEVVKTDNAKEALIASINQRGKVDISYIMKLSEKDYDSVIDELKGLIYHNPELAKKSINEDLDGWETADQYLSRKCCRETENSRILLSKRYSLCRKCTSSKRNTTRKNIC